MRRNNITTYKRASYNCTQKNNLWRFFNNENIEKDILEKIKLFSFNPIYQESGEIKELIDFKFKDYYENDLKEVNNIINKSKIVSMDSYTFGPPIIKTYETFFNFKAIQFVKKWKIDKLNSSNKKSLWQKNDDKNIKNNKFSHLKEQSKSTKKAKKIIHLLDKKIIRKKMRWTTNITE